MRHFTIATAGHVDHGKSTLVRALTGINPDRLIEEQKREMTIDLGFAYMTLPTQAKDVVGIIDVPGHIDFIENMLAGVGGIDAALLVIAADEGPMPQTREHLAILDLLNIQRGVVALTKTDLAPDADWVPLITEDVRALLAATPLRDAPIVPVSARTGEGIKPLVNTLRGILEGLPAREDTGKPYLAIDRSFSIAGFGTVVTGTLLGGSVAIGDELHILPKGLATRVRGLQTHKQKLERALPGSRCAINLTGVSVDEARRGGVLAAPGLLTATTLIDARVELRAYDSALLHANSVLLKHNQQVKLFVGAAETVAITKLLEGNELRPGHAAWVQFELASPLAVTRGDRFIVRLPSPNITLGGGTVADPNPARLYRRRAGHVAGDVIARVEAAFKGTPAERLEAALKPEKVLLLDEALKLAALAGDEAQAALVEGSQVLTVEGAIALGTTWQKLHAAAAQMLGSFHKAQPLAGGMPKDTLRSRLGLGPREFAALLKFCSATEPAVLAEGDTVRLAAHVVQFSTQQQQQVNALLKQMRAQPWNTPLIKDCKAQVGDAVFDVLIRQRTLKAVNADVVFLSETYDAGVAKVKDAIRKNGQITAAEARDLFNTSRKYSLGLLEHLDEIGVTKRVGDARVLKN